MWTNCTIRREATALLQAYAPTIALVVRVGIRGSTSATTRPGAAAHVLANLASFRFAG
jgi:hypothetical protein